MLGIIPYAGIDLTIYETLKLVWHSYPSTPTVTTCSC